ncbi:MAG TPA: hypothetical protein VE595_00865 [Nitrososphaeraceae archaeon]|nr:hypothetical protein [Nitrososphaeraceae archaeon]
MIQKYSNCFVIAGSFITIAFLGGATFVDSFGVMNPNLVQSTTDGSLDVSISPSSEVINTNDQVKFKINFFEPGTDKIQVHVDYDFQILNNGEEIFSAAKQISQPLLHTAEGSVTIPFTFSSPGGYSINIPVLGINFVPINPESAKFEFTVK